ncbi:ATPase, partial [Halolamina litorea]
GSGERQYAYARNRTLRKAGVIEHAGAGRYRYALTDLVDEAFDGTADGQTVADAVAAIESATDID